MEKIISTILDKLGPMTVEIPVDATTLPFMVKASGIDETGLKKLAALNLNELRKAITLLYENESLDEFLGTNTEDVMDNIERFDKDIELFGKSHRHK